MRGLAPAVSLILFGVLCAAVGGEVPWFDGGELSAAAANLGISHPTGFPLWALLGRAAASLPFGDQAFRVNLLCAGLLAGAGGLTAGLVARAVGQGERASLAGCVAALGLVVGRSAWLHGTQAEVYALQVFSLAALWVLAEGLRRGAELRWLAAFGLAAGLLMGGHGELRLLVVPLACVCAWPHRRALIAPGPLASAALLMTLGLGVYLLLPLRAAAGVSVDWGHPVSLGALWEHVSAQRIRAAYADRILRPFGPRTLTDLASYGRILLVESGPLLPLAGLGWICARRRGWGAVALVAALLWGLDLLYVVLINPMGLADLQNGLPGYLALAVMAGLGVASLPGGRGLARAAALSALLATLWLGGSQGRLAVAGARAYGSAGLAQLGPHGLLLTTSDHLSASTLYLQRVEGARPDLFHLVRQHAWHPAHTRDLAPLTGGGPVHSPTRLALAQRSERPVRWEHGGGGEELALGASLQPGVPAFAVVGQGAPSGGTAGQVLEEVKLRVGRVLGSPPALGPPQATGAAHLNQLGIHLIGRGAASEAARAFSEALLLNPASVAAHVNLGSLASRRGRLEEAADWTRRALALAPNQLTTLVNLGRYELALRHNEAAGESFERALALAPASAAAHSGLGAVEANRGHRKAAIGHLLTALMLDPDLQEARTNLARLRGLQPSPAAPQQGR